MRRSPRSLRIASNHSDLTHFGGIRFFHDFLRLLQFRDFLARHLVYPKGNYRYSLAQMPAIHGWAETSCIASIS